MKFGHARLPARLGTAHKLTVSGTSAATEVFNASTKVVRVCSSVAAYIKIGPKPSEGQDLAATADDVLLPAWTIENIEVAQGDQLAALQFSSGGTLSVCELTNI